jgi:predicted dehydrogenase
MLHIQPSDIFRHQIKNFLNCIESGVAPRVTIDDAAAVLEMIEAVRKAHAENRTVFL